MIGIMLAGGHATRLPFKPLLPMKDGKIMAVNAARRMLSNGCKFVVSVINEKDTALRSFLAPLGPVAFDEHDGVTGAILAGVERAIELAPSSRDDLFAIFCCDNTYPREIYGARGATVRYVHPSRCLDLDGVLPSSGEYVHRGDDRAINHMRERGAYLALTTPWIVDYDDIKMLFSCRDLIGWLDLIRLPPVILSADGWDDLGTPAAYQAYWDRP